MAAAQSAKTHSSKQLKLLLLGIIGFVIIGLILLGNWQLRRLDAKLDLIERVENRAFAAPIPVPGEADWPTVTRESHEYLHVRIRGRFLHNKETLVQAVTERGGGYWVLTPLLTDAGTSYLINRGYVPVDAANPDHRRAGLVGGDITISGLLRISEPDGILLRPNDPASDRWYSRDVVAIAQSRNLDKVAPYFIDADFADIPGGLPIGGMTRLQFRNAHLFYALTWYCLALTLTIMTLWVIRLEKVSFRKNGW